MNDTITVKAVKGAKAQPMPATVPTARDDIGLTLLPKAGAKGGDKRVGYDRVVAGSPHAHHPVLGNPDGWNLYGFAEFLYAGKYRQYDPAGNLQTDTAWQEHTLYLCQRQVFTPELAVKIFPVLRQAGNWDKLAEIVVPRMRAMLARGEAETRALLGGYADVWFPRIIEAVK